MLMHRYKYKMHPGDVNQNTRTSQSSRLENISVFFDQSLRVAVSNQVLRARPGEENGPATLGAQRQRPYPTLFHS